MTDAAVTQSIVYSLFKDIDRMPGIIEARLGRWRAWPIAKMPLVWHLMYPQSARQSAPGFAAKLRDRLSYSVRDLSTALRQLPRLFHAPAGGTIGLLYVPRLHRFEDGQLRDAIFGGLLGGEGLSLPTVALEQRPWGLRYQRADSIANSIYLDPYQSAAEMLAVCLTVTPAIRNAGGRLDTILAEANLPIEPGLRHHKVLLALAYFEARRRIFRYLLKRLGVRLLVLTYGPGRTGEIAAAKELGIPIIELQHGVISAHCPDYAWPSDYLTFKAELPLPDHVALFGPLFRREIMRSGYWTERDTSAVGAAGTASYRRRANIRERRGGPLRLLYMTQSTVRDVAIEFWHAFIKDGGLARSDCELLLKLHPEESARRTEYGALTQLAPHRVRILPTELHPFEAMLDADAVLSYNSMSLVEALGLGTPAISLCGGTIPEGFAGTFELWDLVAVMPHIRTPAELDAVVRGRLGDATARAQWQAQAIEYGRDYFSDGFADAAARLINGMVPRSVAA